MHKSCRVAFAHAHRHTENAAVVCQSGVFCYHAGLAFFYRGARMYSELHVAAGRLTQGHLVSGGGLLRFMM